MAVLTDSEVDDLAPAAVRAVASPPRCRRSRRSRFARKFPVHVLNGYGQAEIGEVIGWTAADAKAHPEKVGAIGRPHPGVDISRWTKRRPTGESLLVRPPNTASRARRSRPARRRRLHRHRRSRPHRRGRLRLDRGPRRRRDQPRRQQGLPGARRGGAAPRTRWTTWRSWGRPTIGSARCRWPPRGRPRRRRDLEALCREHLVPYKVPVRSSRSTSSPAARSARCCDDSWLRRSMPTRTCSPSAATRRPTKSSTRSGGGSSSTCRLHRSDAARRGGTPAIREVRSRAAYEAWYPVFPRAGLVAPTWPVEYGGLDLGAVHRPPRRAELRPFNLGRLNPLGLNLAAPALFAHGTEEQRLRFLPPIVRNEEKWCQLFSEPGAGSDLASLATRAERDGDEWVLTGQKVWTTWAHVSDFGVLLARTDPDAPKRKGITYFLLDLHQPGVEVRPLRHMTARSTSTRCSSTAPACPTPAGRRGRRRLEGRQRHAVGRAPDGLGLRAPAASTASAGRASSTSRAARRPPREPVRRGDDPSCGSADARLQRGAHPRLDQPAGAGRDAGRPLTRARRARSARCTRAASTSASRLLATDLLGSARSRWHGRRPTRRTTSSLPYEVHGMLRSRANTIEGGTTEVNKNILGERVLGLPARARSVARTGLARGAARELTMTVRDASIRAARSRRLADLRPARRRQRDERHHDGRARSRVARARRRPRGARHRQHRQRSGVPDRPRRRADRHGQRRAARALPPDHATPSCVHRVAPAAPQAGDRRGATASAPAAVCTSWPTPTSSSRRATRRSSIRTSRSAKSSPTRRIALARKSPMEPILRMALVGRHERSTAQRAYQLGILSARSSTRPSACATKRRSWPRRSPGTLPRRCGHASRRCGARSSQASPTPAGPGRTTWSRLWGHPDQDEGPACLRREAAQADVTTARDRTRPDGQTSDDRYRATKA